MEPDNFSAARPATARFETLPLDLIDDPERPMRTDISPESVADLVASIKQVGIIEPLVVIQRGDRYEVVAGHRRVTAAEIAGLHMVPCHVVEGTQEQVEMMKIHENLYRVDVNPYDEAQHYARLIKDMKLSPTKIARFTNRSDNYVRDRLRILDFDPILQEALQNGKLNLTVALELHRIPDAAKLREMIGYAVGHGVTGAVAKKWVDEQLPQNQALPGLPPIATDNAPLQTASEQHSECFYCLNPVRLWDAYTVYVHEDCVRARKRQADELTPEDAPPAE
jgi:ParB family transcriptional regulator, chromosome partitioning protein